MEVRACLDTMLAGEVQAWIGEVGTNIEEDGKLRR